MRTHLVWISLVGLTMVSPAGLRVKAQPAPSKTLDIYFIDVEGGQATLFVAPSRESLLVDTGFPGDRDAGRILDVMKEAGVQQLDHLLLTHYHVDHIGNVQSLAGRIPIKHFYDHGATAEPEREQVPGFQKAYAELFAKIPRTSLKPGDKVPFTGVDWRVVTSAAQVIKTPLSGAPGAGKPNASCTGFEPKNTTQDPDNGHSVGSVITYGKFRTIDLGDLYWDREFDLMCPTNRVGTVDLYIVSHHGSNLSGSAALVHALQPRVAVMDNGGRKGGSASTFAVLEASPGLEDIWQLHWSVSAGTEHNAPGAFIANVEDNAALAALLTAPPGQGGGRGNTNAGHTPAYLIKVSAQQDGTFTVTNTRNGFGKTYREKNQSGR
jgi:beta-lactamase superfamily II metal-dependent hydrolase